MTTVIFVHGISVREPKFSEEFKQIKGNFDKELENKNVENITITPCSWGSSLGAKLNAKGASIPFYDSTRNSKQLPQPDEAAFGQWLNSQLLKLPTEYLQRRRGEISDITYPVVGDIILYQARGQEIRDLIKSYIKSAKPPVVLLAHSLGGVACVDLLVEGLLNEKEKDQLKKVKLLVTVGSQAPYFYEVNALQSLKYDQPLDKDFPSWLNIYDSRDFISFIGGNIFPDKVQDIPVDNPGLAHLKPY